MITFPSHYSLQFLKENLEKFYFKKKNLKGLKIKDEKIYYVEFNEKDEINQRNEENEEEQEEQEEEFKNGECIFHIISTENYFKKIKELALKSQYYVTLKVFFFSENNFNNNNNNNQEKVFQEEKKFEKNNKIINKQNNNNNFCFKSATAASPLLQSKEKKIDYKTEEEEEKEKEVEVEKNTIKKDDDGDDDEKQYLINFRKNLNLYFDSLKKTFTTKKIFEFLFNTLKSQIYLISGSTIIGLILSFKFMKKKDHINETLAKLEKLQKQTQKALNSINNFKLTRNINSRQNKKVVKKMKKVGNNMKRIEINNQETQNHNHNHNHQNNKNQNKTLNQIQNQSLNQNNGDVCKCEKIHKQIFGVSGYNKDNVCAHKQTAHFKYVYDIVFSHNIPEKYAVLEFQKVHLFFEQLIKLKSGKPVKEIMRVSDEDIQNETKIVFNLIKSKFSNFFKNLFHNENNNNNNNVGDNSNNINK